tara:strand:- start:5346 stop:5549 length:204 start_codon:yes stop_codon:yes gene_type:complete
MSPTQQAAVSSANKLLGFEVIRFFLSFMAVALTVSFFIYRYLEIVSTACDQGKVPSAELKLKYLTQQ